MTSKNRGRGGNKGKGNRTGSGKKSSPKAENKDPVNLLSVQENVDLVRPFWETLSPEDRQNLLTVSIDQLQLPSDGETSNDVVEGSLRRLSERSSWKFWRWNHTEFSSSDKFRAFIREGLAKKDLTSVLPVDDPKASEAPAEAELRKRMSDILQKAHVNQGLIPEENTTGKPQKGRYGRVGAYNAAENLRDPNAETAAMILESLELENEILYHLLVLPVATFVCSLLPEAQRESTPQILRLEDIEKLEVSDAVKLCEWLTEKVDGLTLKMRADPEDEEEDPLGDIDLFALTEDKRSLFVNPKWLAHLQTRLLGQDGHPRKVQPGEDPHKLGLVLEWIYGSIVATAEKARDGAKRSLGPFEPTAQKYYEYFLRSLQDQKSLEDQYKQAKDLLVEMMKSRREAAELGKKYDLNIPDHVPQESEIPTASEFPNKVILSMLRREILLTSAKLQTLSCERQIAEKEIRTYRMAIRQTEPECERLKRELEEAKLAPRSVEGSFRTSLEMERHRHQRADAAIEEQLEIQTALREHNAKLQSIYEKKHIAETGNSKKDAESEQLRKWRTTVQNLIRRLEEVTPATPPAGSDSQATAATTFAEQEGLPDAGTVQQASGSSNDGISSGHSSAASNSEPRTQFFRDMRKQLYAESDDKLFYQKINRQMKSMEKRLEDGKAALQHLEAFVVNSACDDPGAIVGAQLILPLLQERLREEAMDFASEKSRAAADEVIRMEAEQRERAAAERGKKLAAKQRRLERQKSERDRLMAEKKAKEAVEERRRAQEVAEKERLEEEKRQQLIFERERIRREEEALMEKRRQELLADENGYYNKRLKQEAACRAAVEISEKELEPSEKSDGTAWKATDQIVDRSKKQRNRQSRAKGHGGDWYPSQWNGHRSEHKSNGYIREGGYRTKSMTPGKEKVSNIIPAPAPAGEASESERESSCARTSSGESPASGGENHCIAPVVVVEKISPEGMKSEKTSLQELNGSVDKFRSKSNMRDTLKDQDVPAGASADTPSGSSSPHHDTASTPSPKSTASNERTLRPTNLTPASAGSPTSLDSANGDTSSTELLTGSSPGVSSPYREPRRVYANAGALAWSPVASQPHMAMGHKHIPVQSHESPPICEAPFIHAQQATCAMMQMPHQNGGYYGQQTMPYYYHAPVPNGVHMPTPRFPLATPHARPFFPQNRVIYQPHHSHSQILKPLRNGGHMDFAHHPRGSAIYTHGTVRGMPLHFSPSHVGKPSHANGIAAGGSPMEASFMQHSFPHSSQPLGFMQREIPRKLSNSTALRVTAPPFVPASHRSKEQDVLPLGVEKPAARNLSSLEANVHPVTQELQSSDGKSGPVGIPLLKSLGESGPTANMRTPSMASSTTQHSDSEIKIKEGQASDAGSVSSGKATDEEIHRSSSLASTTSCEGSETRPVRTEVAIPVPSAARIFVSRSVGGVTFTGPDGFWDALKEVKGLANPGGNHNCFLNVVLQALWHLPGVKEKIHEASTLLDNVKTPDAKVCKALDTVFCRMEANIVVDQPDSRLVSPTELRTALVEAGERSGHDMGDASEVYHHILSCLDRTVNCQSPYVDPTLPVRMKLSEISLQAFSKESWVQTMFGCFVHIPAPLEDTNVTPPRDKEGFREAGGRGRRGRRRGSPRASANGNSSCKATPTPSEDAFVFQNLVQLAPANGIRNATGPASFGQKLAVAIAEDKHQRPVLLREPTYFTLGIGWESYQVSKEKLGRTLYCLQGDLDLSEVYGGEREIVRKRQNLRCIVAFAYHHYKAYGFSTEANAWIGFDDARIDYVGSWTELMQDMEKTRHQPSLLFFSSV